MSKFAKGPYISFSFSWLAAVARTLLTPLDYVSKQIISCWLGQPRIVSGQETESLKELDQVIKKYAYICTTRTLRSVLLSELCAVQKKERQKRKGATQEFLVPKS